MIKKDYIFIDYIFIDSMIISLLYLFT